MKNTLKYLVAVLWLSQIFPCSLFAAKQEFAMRISSDPPTLDWNLASDNVSITLLYNLMEGLSHFNEKLEPKPALASSWEISEDGRTYTYHLRKNIFWSDGAPITAQQFVDSWERLLNPKTASEYAYFLFDVLNAKDYAEGKLNDASKLGFHAQDPQTFVVTLTKPAAYFAQIPTFTATFPIRKELIEKFGASWTNPGKLQVTGPFTLSEWKHDAKLVLSANPKYYGGKPKLEKVQAYVINEDTTAINMFESGTLQYVSRLPPLELDRLKKSPAYRHSPYLRGYYYGFNVKKKPFDDVRVRQAFALAVDRKQITDILKGGQIPTTSWVPKGIPGYEPDIGLSFDVKKAKSLLAAAGYPDGKGFPEITFNFDTRDDNKLIAEKLQSMWQENLGVKLHAQNEDWKMYLDHLSQDAPGLYRMGWGADYPDADNFLELFTSYSGNNYARWKNAAYDNLILKGATEPKLKKRLAYYREAQKLLTEDDAVIIPLFIDSLNVLVAPKVSGLNLNALDYLELRNVQMN